MSDDGKLMTISALAEKLNVNRSSVYRYIEANEISPVLRTGKTRFYDANTLDRLRKHFAMSVKTGTNNTKKQVNDDNDALIMSLKEQIEQLKGSNKVAVKQLEVKDAQIASLQANLSKNQELLDHNQQLLLAAQNDAKKIKQKTSSDKTQTGDFKEVNDKENVENESSKKAWWHFW